MTPFCRSSRFGREPAIRNNFLYLLLIFIGVSLFSVRARAEMGETLLHGPLSGAASHLFPLNPAEFQPSAAQAGVFLLQRQMESSLDQSPEDEDDGQKLTSEIHEDFVNFSAVTDLGAGAGLGLSHQTLYREVTTGFDDEDFEPRIEREKIQHSSIKVVVELTSELTAGLAIRYLYKENELLGNFFVNDSDRTRFRTAMIGYGSGAAYEFSQGALAYAYFPPLRGKTDIYGEEKIIVEPGMIAVDGYYETSSQWKLGIAGQRWIHELDDRAQGTTTENDTGISLYGLNVDQYLFTTQLLMVGAEYQGSKKLSIAGVVGREDATFNFRDLRRFSGIDIRQRRNDPDLNIQYYRIRAMVKFVHNTVELYVGGGLVQRDHTFPESMESSEYKASGKEVFVTMAVKL